jgi:hypothetical protein
VLYRQLEQQRMQQLLELMQRRILMDLLRILLTKTETKTKGISNEERIAFENL